MICLGLHSDREFVIIAIGNKLNYRIQRYETNPLGVHYTLRIDREPVKATQGNATRTARPSLTGQTGPLANIP